MTQLLQKAIDAIQQLPGDKQDALASLSLDEIAADKCWDEAFARTDGKLARLAANVREGIATGRVLLVGDDSP